MSLSGFAYSAVHQQHNERCYRSAFGRLQGKQGEFFVGLIMFVLQSGMTAGVSQENDVFAAFIRIISLKDSTMAFTQYRINNFHRQSCIE